MDRVQIKELMKIDLINFSSFSKPLTSEYFQNKYNVSDNEVRRFFKLIETEESKKQTPKYFFGSTDDGFFIAQNYNEAEAACRYLENKFKSIAERHSQRISTRDRLFKDAKFKQQTLFQ